MFSVNARQCCVCGNLTCVHCVENVNISPLEEEKDPVTGLFYPDTCSLCKKKNKLIVGALGEPNVLAGIQQDNLFKIKFKCPYQCGRQGMKITDLFEHAVWFCELKPFECKAQLIEREAH